MVQHRPRAFPQGRSELSVGEGLVEAQPQDAHPQRVRQRPGFLERGRPAGRWPGWGPAGPLGGLSSLLAASTAHSLNRLTTLH